MHDHTRISLRISTDERAARRYCVARQGAPTPDEFRAHLYGFRRLRGGMAGTAPVTDIIPELAFRFR